eukprot:7149126-Pyramimonas_sp.AAC.1
MATTMIKVFGIESFDSVPLGHGATLDTYINDSGLNCEGTISHIISRLAQSGEALRVAIADLMQA